MSETPALPGRIDSYYNYKTVNDQGLATIEATVVVRDQAPENASLALLGALEGITKPAQAQIKG